MLAGRVSTTDGVDLISAIYRPFPPTRNNLSHLRAGPRGNNSDTPRQYAHHARLVYLSSFRLLAVSSRLFIPPSVPRPSTTRPLHEIVCATAAFLVRPPQASRGDLKGCRHRGRHGARTYVILNYRAPAKSPRLYRSLSVSNFLLAP